MYWSISYHLILTISFIIIITINFSQTTLGKSEVPNGRPPPEKRLFKSSIVEELIANVSSRIAEDTLRQIFINCLPNTLDTTVYFRKNVTEPVSGLNLPYTYIVTGDIAAMWLRDSTYQVQPYIPLASSDPDLRLLILGLINTQAEMIQLYPYANAYFPLKHWNSGINLPPSEWAINDTVFPTYKKDEVYEAKYELDSLASFLYLTKTYTEHTNDYSYLNNPNWKSAFNIILKTLRKQQASTFEVINSPPYKFSRPTTTQSETTNLYGIGNPVKRCGLIRSFFRPSDDSTIYQYLIPSNALIVVSLDGIIKILQESQQSPQSSGLEDAQYLELLNEAIDIESEVREAIQRYGIIQHLDLGQEVYAYEVDCYGSYLLMDDGNLPSLLSLPKFGFVNINDPIYINTRNYILSPEWNPYFTIGQFPGIGSPHTGLQRSWHLAQIVQAMTSIDENEIRYVLNILRNTTAGKGFMHEAYNVNNPNDFSRDWFAWANTLFGDLILYLDKEFPHLLGEFYE